jgi:HSP20 family protein
MIAVVNDTRAASIVARDFLTEDRRNVMAGTLTESPRRKLTPWFRRGPLATLREEMEELFEPLLGEAGDGWGTRMLAPPIDLSETDTAIQARLDLPGVDSKEIDIQVSGNQLTIAGERKEEKEEKGELFHRIERRCGRFSRSVTLPCNVDEDKIDATYRDGVLNITLPKTEAAKAKRIEVKA